MKEKFLSFFNNLSKYLTIPMIIILLLSVLSEIVTNKIIGKICRGLSIFISIIWLILIIIFILTKKCKIKTNRGILVSSIVLFIISVLLSLFHYFHESNLYFIIAVIFFELYAIGYIIYNIMKQSAHITNIIIMCLVFIVLGYCTIYFSTYGYEENALFNSLITLFSAIIGGALTLGGVAWTLKNQKEQKMDEDKEKAKPYFKFIKVNADSSKLAGTCTDGTLDRNDKIFISSYIKNSHLSLLKLKKIFHDDTQFDLMGCSMILPDEVVRLDFCIENANKKVFLEVDDALGLKHYYKLIMRQNSNFYIDDCIEISEKEFNTFTH